LTGVSLNNSQKQLDVALAVVRFGKTAWLDIVALPTSHA
jgi:hypothetical protein